MTAVAVRREARATTRRFGAARSRSPAGCCRARCATTPTSCTSSSARSTTSSTSGHPRRRRARPRRSRPGRRGPPPRATPETTVLEGPRAATRSRGPHCAGFCAGHAPRPVRRGRSEDRGRRGPRPLPRGGHRRRSSMAAVLGTPGRVPARRPRRWAWRCNGRTSCATSTRTAAAGRVDLARETLDALRRASTPARASRCCAIRSPRADALYEQGLRRDGGCDGPPAIAAAAAMYRELLRQIEREGYGLRDRAARSSRARASLAMVARGARC